MKDYTVVLEKLMENRQILDWSDIRQYIYDQRIEPRNWMTVRSALQGLINAGHLRRTKDLLIEQYEVL